MKTWQDIKNERDKDTNPVSTKWQDIVAKRGGTQKFSDYNNDSTENSRVLPKLNKEVKKIVPKVLKKNTTLTTQAQRTGVNGRPLPLLDAKKLDKAAGVVAPFAAGLSNVAGITEAVGLNNEYVKENPNKRFTTVNGRGIPVSLKLPDITPYAIGNLASMGVTGGVISKGIKPVTKAVEKKLTYTIAKKIVPKAIDTVAQATGFTVPQDIIKGKSAKETLKDTALNTATFAGMNVGLKGLGKLWENSIKPNEVIKAAETPKVVDTPVIKPNKPIKKIELSGTKFKVNNPQYEKAVAKYNDAIETIQNHFQTNKLIPEEIAQIKPKLGIDLDALTNNVAKYENKLNLKEISNKQNQKYVYGVEGRLTPSIRKPLTNTNMPINNKLASTAPTESLIDIKGFDKHYGLDQLPNKSNITKLVEDVGRKVIGKTGTTDIPTIVKHYVEKYKLPEDVKVSFNARKDVTKGSTTPIRDGNGKVIGAKININPNQSLESKIGSLRHEIEHYKDLNNGYMPPTSKYKFNPKVDTTGRTLYENASKGHHQNYNWFEADYLKNSELKDNVIPSAPIVETVSKEIPIQGIKPSKQPLIPTGDTVESGFSKNVKTDLNMNEELRKSFADTPVEHDILNNSTTLKSAQDRYNQGYEVALKDFRENPTLRPDDIPLARMLANESAKRGDIATAREIITKTADKLTDAGRIGQAARILRRSDPSVFVGYLEKQVSKLNDEGLKIYGNKWTQIKIPDSEVKEIYKLEIYDEDSMQKAMERVYNKISEQMPSTNMEKFNSWRRMSMLLNPLTHIRNVTGNTLFSPLRKTSDILGAGMEKLLPVSERTKSVGWSRDPKIKSLVDEDWDKVGKDLANGNTRWELNQVLGREKRIFKNNTLEKINKFSGKSLEAEDTPFLKNAYKDSLGGYIKARGLTEATQDARDYASRRALEATYKDMNRFSELITSIKNKSGIFGEAILPFAKTPANLSVRAFEHSPYGLVTELGKAAYQVKKGTFNPTRFIEQISKGITGTIGLTGLGFGLAHAGIITGSASSDKDQAASDKQNGKLPYSITIGGKNFTYDFAQPVALPLAMGAEIYNKIKDKSGALDTAYSSMIAGGDTLFNSSMLKSIKAVFGGTYSSPTEAIANTMMNYPKQAVPTILGQVAKVADTNERDISGSGMKEILQNFALSKTPVASQSLPKKINTRGEEVKTGNVGFRILQNMLLPSKVTNVSTNPVDKLIQKVYDSTGDKNVFPKVAPKQLTDNKIKYTLTPQEKNDFQKAMGEETYKRIKSMLNSSATDKQKAKIIDKIIDKSYDKAKNNFLKLKKGGS